MLAFILALLAASSPAAQLITPSTASPPLPVARTPVAGIPVAGNLLKNPGFESGRDELEPWVHAVPLSIATTKPEFAVTELDPAKGKRSASLRVDYYGGYTCYAQTLRVPPKAKSIHLEGKARLDRVSYEGGALLMLTFIGPDIPGGQKSVSSRRLSGVADWTLLAVDASIPPGTKSVEVRCGVEGPCVASFDEMLATSTREDAHEVSFGWLRSDYLVRWPANSVEELLEPFVRVSLPLSGEGQRPVAFRVNTRPEDKVSSVSIHRQGANRTVEIRMTSMFPGDEIKLRLEALVMIDTAEVELPSLVRLPRPGQIKGDMLRYIGSSPGVNPEDPGVARALFEIKGNDLPSVLRASSGYVQGALKMRAKGGSSEDTADVTLEVDDSVAACLKSGTAGPIGFANTLTSVLRGEGIPARMMLAKRMGETVGTDYFVDVWTPAIGWTRMDPLTGEWPVARSLAVVRRMVEPEDPRLDGYTPFDPMVATSGLVFEPRPDRLSRTHVYRAGDAVTLMEGGWNEVLRRVEASEEEVLGDALPGSTWLSLTGARTEAEEIPGASRAHLEVQRWLDAPRLVGQ